MMSATFSAIQVRSRCCYHSAHCICASAAGFGSSPRIQEVRSEIALFSTTDQGVIHAGLQSTTANNGRHPDRCSSLLIIILSNATNPLAPPQGFQTVAQLDLFCPHALERIANPDLR